MARSMSLAPARFAMAAMVFGPGEPPLVSSTQIAVTEVTACCGCAFPLFCETCTCGNETVKAFGTGVSGAPVELTDDDQTLADGAWNENVGAARMSHDTFVVTPRICSVVDPVKSFARSDGRLYNVCTLLLSSVSSPATARSKAAMFVLHRVRACCRRFSRSTARRASPPTRRA